MSTLAELRRAVARLVKDYQSVTATATSSDKTSFTDTRNLWEDRDRFRGADILFTSGTNSGLKRRITGSTLAGSISWAQGADTTVETTAIPQAGDTADVFNLKGRGYRIEHYNEALSTALKMGHPQTRLVRVETLTPALVTTVDRYAIPANFTHVTKLQYQDSTGWHDLPKSGGANYRWEVDLQNMEIALDQGIRYQLDGKPVRLTGYQRHTDLVNDTDICNVDDEWLISKATGLLLLADRNEENLAWGQYWLNRADAMFPRMASTSVPGTIKVRD